MGNVVNGNAPNQLEESEEWLHDLRTNRVLDFSRKVSHSQYLKVQYVKQQVLHISEFY